MQISRLAALVLLISGCQFDPNVDFYTTTEPAVADVVGRYTLTNQSVAPGGSALLTDNLSVIELRGDGTFTATNVPPSGSDPRDDKFFEKLITDSGTWTIDAVGSIANGDHPPKKHWGISFNATQFDIMPVGLTGSGSPFGLIFTLGDPDGGHVMVLEREK